MIRGSNFSVASFGGRIRNQRGCAFHEGSIRFAQSRIWQHTPQSFQIVQYCGSVALHRKAYFPPLAALTRQHSIRLVARRFKSNQSTKEASKAAAKETTTITEVAPDMAPFVGTFLWRLCLAYGMVYVFWEYGVEITITEGPSMMNTLQGHGDEIVLMDRFTPARLGLQGGSSGAQRAEVARRKQREFVKDHPSPTPQIWHEPKIPANLLSPKDVWARFKAHFWTPISVGDVVVLQHPDRAGTVCKRVLGLPGDVVTKPISRRGVAKLEWTGKLPIEDDVAAESSVHALTSTALLPYHTNIGNLKRQRATTVIVPDGHLWVEGDNPWNSNDSRNYGAIPASLIVGRVVCRIWPIKGNAMIERGDRPIHMEDTVTRPSLAFSGSIVFPAGYCDQIIVREYHQWQRIMQKANTGFVAPFDKAAKPLTDNARSLAATAAEPKE